MQQYEVGMEWIFERIYPLVEEVNDKYFKFDMPSPPISEALQVTHYPTGGVYEWHQDFNLTTSPQQTRKISFGVQLSDSNSYEGGDLQFQLPRNMERNVADRRRGAITFFPSWTMHRLDTLQKGERFSLIGWCHGNRFV